MDQQQSKNRRLTGVLERFEEAWDVGAEPDIETFLPPTDSADVASRVHALVALVALDLKRRWQSGTGAANAPRLSQPGLPARPLLDDYVAQFPELGSLEELPPELVCEEYRVRNDANDRVSVDGYLERFPQQQERLRVLLTKSDGDDALTPTIDSEPIGLTHHYQSIDDETQQPGTLETSAGTDHGHASERAEVGQTFGDYEILEAIARGGMGMVFKARQKKANRVVALKTILSGNLASEDEVKRFYAEAEAAAGLDHPNIVPVFDVGEEGDQHYFTMGLVEGQSLKDRVQDGPLPPHEAAAMVRTIAEAVAYAHAKGVIHRDLKPANVLLDQDGRPRVTDFGLAKQLEGDSNLTTTGQVMGTPNYMPPEQATGRIDEIGPAADVYSLGAILYELLTGRPPFQAASVLDVLRQVLEQEPVAIRTLNPSVARDLETICAKCLEKGVEKRYASAAELAEDLRRFLEHLPIHARPLSRPARAWRWCKRKPVIASLACGLVVAIAAGFGGIASQWIRAEREAERAREQEEIAKTEGKRVKAAQSETVSSLYKALIRESRATRLARRPGYRPQVWTSLQSALQLDTQDQDLGELRQEAVACLGDFLGKEPTDFSDFAAPSRCIALGPGRGCLAVGLQNGIIEIWDRSTSQRIGQLKGHKTRIRKIYLSGDGQSMVSLDVADGLKHWRLSDTRQWSVEETLALDTSLSSPTVSADAKFAAGIRRSELVVQSLRSGRRKSAVFKLDNASPVVPVALSDDGRFVACQGISQDRSEAVGSRVFAVFDVATGALVHQAASPLGRVYSLAFSPDSGLLGIGANQGLVVIDTKKFELQANFLSEVCQHTRFSPDGQLVAVTTPSREALLYSLSGGLLAKLPHPQDTLLGLAFGADGQSLSTVCVDSVRVWDLTSERLVLPGHDGGIPTVKFSPNGELLASCSKDRRVTLWNPATGSRVGESLRFQAPIQAVAFSPDGRALAVGAEKELRIIDNENRNSVTIDSHGLGDLLGIAFSPDGNYLAACGSGLVVWRLKSLDKLLQGAIAEALEEIYRTPGKWCATLCFNADSSTLAWIDNIRNVHSWQVGKGMSETYRLPARLLLGYHGLAFHPDGQHVVLVSSEGNAESWNVKSLKRDGTFSSPGKFRSGHLALSTDGRWLAAHRLPSAIDIWDAISGDHVCTFHSERSPIWSLDWSPDASQLAVGLSDGGLTIWNIPEVRSELAGIGLDWPEEDRSFNPAQSFFAVDDASPNASDDSRQSRIEFYRRQATMFERLENWEVAIEHRSHLIELDSANDEHYVRRGSWYANINKTDEAIADLSTATTINPESPPAWFYRATVYADLGEWKKAIDDCTRAMELDPNTLVVRRLRAKSYANLKQWDNAKSDFAKLTTMQGGSPLDRYQLAVVHLALEDLTGYRSVCQQQLDSIRESGDESQFNNVVWLSCLAPQAVNDIPLLVQLGKQALERDPTSYEYQNTLGAILFRADKFDQAINRLNEAIETDGGRAWDSLFLAMAHHRLGHAAEAQHWLNESEQWIENARRPGKASDTGLHWTDKVELRIVHREAVSLLSAAASAASKEEANTARPIEEETRN